MNILFFSEPSYPRHPGGAGKSTHLLAAGLAARGHTVRILCQSRERTERETIDGVEVHRVNYDEDDALPKQEREPAITRRFLEYLSQEVPLASLDLLYDSGGFLSYFFPVAYQLRRQFGLPCILHFRYLLIRHHLAFTRPGKFNPFSLATLYYESGLNEPTQNFAARLADAVICPSQADAAFVQTVFRPASGVPTVIPEPVELALHDPNAGEALRTELLAPGEQLVFFGGRIDSELKGGDIVIRAFERMLAVRPGLRLLILIKHEGLLEPYRKRLGEKVIARPWIHEGAALAAVLAAADLVLMPSFFESFGMMGAEALAAGTPVVASPVGALPEMIRNGENGFLLQSPDRRRWAAELAELSLRILDDPKLVQRMSVNAHESARRYAVDRVAEQTEALCQTVLSRARAEGLRELHPPAFSAADRARYLELIGSWLGHHARPVAERVLSGWEETAATRCLACTRQNLSEDTRRLVRLSRWVDPQNLWARVRGTWPQEVEAAVAAACPWGLLQKQVLRELSRSGGRTGTNLEFGIESAQDDRQTTGR